MKSYIKPEFTVLVIETCDIMTLSEGTLGEALIGFWNDMIPKEN